MNILYKITFLFTSRTTVCDINYKQGLYIYKKHIHFILNYMLLKKKAKHTLKRTETSSLHTHTVNHRHWWTLTGLEADTSNSVTGTLRPFWDMFARGVVTQEAAVRAVSPTQVFSLIAWLDLISGSCTDKSLIDTSVKPVQPPSLAFRPRPQPEMRSNQIKWKHLCVTCMPFLKKRSSV